MYCPHTHSLTYSLNQSPTHLFTRTLNHTHTLSHSQSLTQSLQAITHSLTHSMLSQNSPVTMRPKRKRSMAAIKSRQTKAKTLTINISENVSFKSPVTRYSTVSYVCLTLSFFLFVYCILSTVLIPIRNQLGK